MALELEESPQRRLPPITRRCHRSDTVAPMQTNLLGFGTKTSPEEPADDTRASPRSEKPDPEISRARVYSRDNPFENHDSLKDVLQHCGVHYNDFTEGEPMLRQLFDSIKNGKEKLEVTSGFKLLRHVTVCRVWVKPCRTDDRVCSAFERNAM